jgi:hypothetical protein
MVTYDNSLWYCILYAPSGYGPFGGYIDVYWVLSGVGYTGPTGTNGTNGTNGTIYVSTGLYNISSSYAVDDLAVSLLDNNTYVCFQAVGSNVGDPSINNTNWTLFVNGGPAGAGSSVGGIGAIQYSSDGAGGFAGSGVTTDGTNISMVEGYLQDTDASNFIQLNDGDDNVIISTDNTSGNITLNSGMGGVVITTKLDLATAQVFDSTPSAGSAGQILSSTSTGVSWIANTGLVAYGIQPFVVGDFSASGAIITGYASAYQATISTALTSMTANSVVQCTTTGNSNTPADILDYGNSWIISCAPQAGGDIIVYVGARPVSASVGTPYLVAWTVLEL